MMKKFSLVLLLGLLVLVIGCSKKKSTQPEPEPDYTLQASQTIGPEGDTLVISDFSLIVPPGAFASNATLKLYASSKDKPFGDYGVTRTFRLEGLPAEYSKPLPVRIQYQGTLSNESFIALGTAAYVVSVDTLVTAYNLFPATDSSGYLLGELPARTASEVTYNAHHFYARPKEDQGSALSLYLSATTGYFSYTSPGGHFDIRFPAGLLTQVKSLANYLDAAYDTSIAMGFTNVTQGLPPVYLYHISLNSCGDYEYPYRWWGDSYKGSLYFNSDSLAKPNLLPQMRITAGREFFRFVLALYDRSILPGELHGKFPVRFWLHNAVVLWSEQKFTENPDHCPYDFKGNEMVAFHGMNAVTENTTRSHGFGMSAVIKYLVDQYGQDFLIKIYKEMDPKKNPVGQIINGIISDPEYVWWPGFFKDYVSGKIYGVKSNVFLDNKSGVFDITSESDTLKTFSGSYPDLSAKIYIIALDYPDIDSSAKIRFQLSATDVHPDYMTVLVFGLKNDSLQYFGQGGDLVVEQVRELTDQGWDLLAVVVNSFNEPPYNSSSDIDLVVTVPKPSFDWNWGSVNVSVLGHFEDSWGRQWDAGSGSGCGSHSQYGSFSGNTFTAFWDSTYYDYYDRKNHFWGNMTITIDPATNTIISLHVIDTTQTTEYHHDTITCISSLAGSNIPFTNMGIGWADYQVLGTDACNHIDDLVQHTDYGDWWDEIKSYDCPSINNFISVRFMKK